ncbi:hypothetical protein [Dictyobacter kobayashii]|uniref:Uncharacterized protein n=1 Tax=Dictyobacter kobayashii TaxID=2014872 RepID=A0A402AJ62_9CHLR|nr:hypothetical protein [Dictyobacter kobayashii]GCE19095.1 hypothetical protein KDK_28950 [Dictyobacter kobayashii]
MVTQLGSCRFKFEHASEQNAATSHSNTSTPVAEPAAAPPPQPPIAHPPAITHQHTDPLRRLPQPHPITNPGFPLSSGTSKQQTDPYQAPIPAISMQRVPQRRFSNNENSLRLLEQQRLTRQHRQVFLLIDNRRSPLELARLTSRRLDELYVILTDLERAGLIFL